ncbi:hypothetical protein ABPG74_011607 [Tetrahymena malaccensis]
MSRNNSPNKIFDNYQQNPYLANAQNSTNNTQLVFQSNLNQSNNQFRPPQNIIINNNKLSHSRLTQVAQQNQNAQNIQQIFSQQCIYHPEMIITNFCKKSLMPLCPKCITSYLKSRESNNQPVEIENIDKIQTECKEAVQELEELYASDLKKLRDAKEQKENIQVNLAEKILFAKNKVIKVIDSYFENLENDLGKQLHFKKTHFEKELSMAEGFAQQKHQELHSIKQKLDGPKYLKYILRLLSENFFDESAHYHQECEQFIQLISKKSIDIFTDDSKLYNLNIELAKFASIKNSEIFYDEDDLNFNFEDKNPYTATNYNQPQNTLYQSKLNENPQQQQQFSQQPLNTNQNNKMYQNQLSKSAQNIIANPQQNNRTGPFDMSVNQSPIKATKYNVLPPQDQSRAIQQSQNPYLNDNNPVLAQRQQEVQQDIPKSVPIPSKPSPNSDFLGSFQKQEFPNQVSAAPLQASMNQSFNPRTIVNKNYFDQFCHQKYIYYFQPGTNELYFIDLNTIVNDNQIVNIRWQKIELDISFKIPNDHQTVITPQGDVYLCGGIDPQTMQVWSECYKVDFKYRTLEKKPNMMVSRFLHGLVYLNNALYVLGGFDQQHQLLDKCERLNLSDRQWVKIAPMIGQSAQMGVCVYKNKYIIAFSVAVQPKINLIQYYEPMFDQWREVMLSHESGLLYSEFLIRPSCGVAQINDSGSIIVFGGDETSRDQVYDQQKSLPNNFVLTLKSESQALQFTVGLGRSPVELFNTSIKGLSYCYNGRVFTTMEQKNTQKVVAFSNGSWIKQA